MERVKNKLNLIITFVCLSILMLLFPNVTKPAFADGEFLDMLIQNAELQSTNVLITPSDEELGTLNVNDALNLTLYVDTSGEISQEPCLFMLPENLMFTSNKDNAEIVGEGATGIFTIDTTEDTRVATILFFDVSESFTINFDNVGLVVPDGTENGSSVSVTLGACTLNFYVTGLENTNEKASCTAPEPCDLTYTGEPQALIKDATNVKGGVVKYCLDYDTETKEGSWNTQIPQATNAGDYDVWYMIEAEEGYDDMEATKVVATISKADSSATVVANTLTYTGEEQELVTASNVVGGKINYSLSDTNWSEDVPTATDANTYTVWYKVAGDSNHKDYVPDGPCSVTISKAEGSVQLEYDNYVYTGAEIELVTYSDLCGAEIKFSLDGVSWLNSSPKVKNVGDYKVYYKITGGNNFTDMSGETNIISITPKALTMDMVSFTLDGETVDEVMLKDRGEVHTFNYVVKFGEIILECGADKDFEFVGDEPQSTYSLVGNYSMTLVGKNNYSGEVTITWKLTQAAAKIGTTCYATLAEAFNAVQKDETITLCSDNNEKLPVLTKTATLDLNGYQIQKKLTTYSSMATLTDSYGGGSVNDGIECEGMLKITNCVVKGEIRNTFGYLWLSDNVKIIGIIYCEDYCNILMCGNITFDTTTYNIFLDTDAKITIIEELTYTEPIKLLNFGTTGKVICENFDTYMPGCDVEDYFVSSQKSCFLKNDEDGIRVYMREIVSQPTSTNFEIGLNYEKGATYAWNKLFGRPITDADVYMPSSTGTFDSGLWHFGKNNALKLYVEGLSKGDYIVVHVMEDNFIRYGESEANNTFVYYVTANGENYIVLQAAESLAGNSFTATIELFKGADAEVVGTDKKLQAVEFEKLYYCVATYDNGFALTSNAVYSLHQHNFAYSVDGATLTATCANNSCNLTENKISATLVAEDVIFDGTQHGATIQNVADFEKVTETTLTIYYEGTGSTTYAKTTTAPTNAGKYKASMTLGDLTAEANFEIKATSIEEAVVTDENGNVVENLTFEIIDAEKGLDPNAKMEVKIETGNTQVNTTISNELKVVGKWKDTDEIAGVYEIKLTVANTEIQPDGKIKLKISVPPQAVGRDFRIYHIHFGDGGNVTVQEVEAVIADGNATFEVNNFSKFAFVVDTATEQKGLTTLQIVLIVLASVLGTGLLGVAVALIVVNSKKKKIK